MLYNYLNILSEIDMDCTAVGFVCFMHKFRRSNMEYSISKALATMNSSDIRI